MKLKYKKIILLTSLSTMGIGLLTLSMSQGSSRAEGQNIQTAQIESGTFEDDNNSNFNDDSVNISGFNDNTNEEASDLRAMAISDSASDNTVAASELTPTPSPTPTPIPVYPLKQVDGLNDFIEEFYIAKTACDVDKLKTMYDDPSKVETREQLQAKVQYIEEYKNIKTYAKESIEEGAYIVYAYHEIKFSSINTLAPGLSKFYVITDENGNYKIAGDLDPEIEEYFNARNEDEDVLALIEMTNKKSEEAKAKDEDLMLFWNALDELAKNGETQTKQNN